MSQKQLIACKLKAAARRRKIQLSWQCMWMGLWICVCIWLLSLISYKLFPVPTITFFWVGLLSFIVPLSGLIWGFTKKFPPKDIARWIDQEKNLKERLSTAVELAEGKPINPAWEVLVLRDAASAVQKIEPKSLLPLRLPSLCYRILLLLIVCFVLGFVPEYRNKNYLDQQRDTAVIDDVGSNLENLTRWQLKQNRPNFEQTKTSLDSVRDLGAEFQKGKIVREDALAKLSDISEKLRSEIKKFGPAGSSIKPSANSPARLPVESQANMKNRLSELAERLGAASGNGPEKFEDIKSKLDAIKNNASDFSKNKLNEGKQSRLDMTQSLTNLSNMAQKLGLELPNLEKAIEALNSSNIDQFLKSMELASQDLEEIVGLSQKIQNLQMEIAETGKDLSEQLEKGQIPTALGTLDAMINQLESDQFSDQQLQDMIDELKQALSPAENYGECAQRLAEAKEAARAGKNSSASQSLAAAKEELKKMLNQMADSQSLMQALQNLDRAQMAVGNSQSFSTTHRPGVSANGKPGGGVGNWANDNYQLSPDQLSARWDNSGYQRPDTSPRGLSDRGNRVPDNFTPTRIKGQINPKGQMPSISLRGVSIKGSSRVELKAAVSAAQSDALNALNQDKVPNAYRDSVRDYFDDLKN